MTNRFSRITSAARFVPETVETNEAVEQRCGLEPGWIKQRTGIEQRPVADAKLAVSDLAIAAGKTALERHVNQRHVNQRHVNQRHVNQRHLEQRHLEQRHLEQNCSGENVDPTKIGMLILATSTPDYLLPPTAPFVAHQLGLQNVPAFDMAVACSGFLYALQLADCYCKINSSSVLVIAANILSRRVSPNDRSAAGIFADGAGAVVVSPSDSSGILSVELESDGAGAGHLSIPDGGSRTPFNEATLVANNHLMKVSNGMAVYRYAVEAMARLGEKAVQAAGLELDDIDFWIPHQANKRIIESVQSRLKLPNEKVGLTIDRFANSSAATIPIALDYFIESERIKCGDLLLLTAAAAGLTAGACVLRL